MIEILLDAVKTALSADARNSASGLVEFIRKSPNWQKDICTLQASINGEQWLYRIRDLPLSRLLSGQVELETEAA